MTSDRRALVDYRLEQTERTLRQARLLANASEWDGVINRAYYAMFYAALALLLTRDLGASKHSGVLALVDREFVRTGQLDPRMSMILRDAFNQRQKSDYSELTPVSRERAEEILENAASFIAAARAAVQPTSRD